MISQTKKIFINQSEPKTVEIKNEYGHENLTIQVECDAYFVLYMYSRIDSKLPYHKMTGFSDNYTIVSAISESGSYSFSVVGKTDIQFQLDSIESGDKLNCYCNFS